LGATLSFASTFQFKAIGASPKGQYVAIEEFGYNAGHRTYFSRIKFINVWKNTYAAPPIEIEINARRPSDLNEVREQALQNAAENLAKYNIEVSS
jgi:predicted secreted protein